VQLQDFSKSNEEKTSQTFVFQHSNISTFGPETANQHAVKQLPASITEMAARIMPQPLSKQESFALLMKCKFPLENLTNSRRKQQDLSCNQLLPK
jgi:hypothetical protein